jgi:acid phosphatase (class A)
MDLNQVTYGNPTKEQKVYLEEDSLVDDLFLKFKEDYFPLNDSELVKDELNDIVDYVNSISDEENKAFLTRYKAYDRSLTQVITTTFKQKGIDVESLCEDIIDDIRNLISKLKYYYQRPRPNQLAQYYKLKLFPFNSFTSSTPSYPSGHTLQAYVILNVIADKYPNEYQFCREMIDDVAYSRLYLGLHFPTDNDFAKEVAKEILKHPKFTKKYGI